MLNNRTVWYAATLVVLGLVGLAWLPRSEARQGGELELVFTYGSEKEEWVKDCTKDFNARGLKTDGGRVIKVVAIPLGSGESVDEILDPDNPRRKAHLTSPASGAYVELGNNWSKNGKKNEKGVLEGGGRGDLLGPTVKLVRSPVVIAMWKPMAEAMGWPAKQLGWKDIHELVVSPQGWALHKQPIWGRFRFGHTHPEFSNSGLISVLAEVYAATGKTDDLTIADVDKAETGKYLEELERGIVHYGSSTGFFGKRMFANSMTYLNAAILYENMVVESYLPPNKGKLDADIVAIYPKEGTFWSDHPVGVVQRPWVTNEHKEAANIYIKFLMDDEQQKKAVKYGFRPGLEKIPVEAPLDRAHGVDPENEPKSEMVVPKADVMERILEVWRKHKKRSRIVMCVDISGSMNDEGKLRSAKRGSGEYLKLLSERDLLSVIVFNSKTYTLFEDKVMDEKGKEEVARRIQGLSAGGRTVLYDAVGKAFDYLEAKPEQEKAEKISAVVVLTDGLDTGSELKLETLHGKIKFDPEKGTPRVFTICYGGSADKPTDEEKKLRKVLKDVAEATKAKDYIADPKNIRKVFVDIATFF